jgi:D-alanyl-D-alanine carboxypeptidase (penicillin-binding protein 5/6)
VRGGGVADRRRGADRRRRLSARRLAALAAATLALLLPGPAGASETAPPSLDARAWALLDPADEELLAARGPGRSYPVASATKLMTAYVARLALRPGEVVVAPGYAPSSGAESLLGVGEGERITTRDLLYGLILASGNDAAVALAVASAGSVPRFVSRMNREAARLDLDDTSYANPIGLDAPGNYSSAGDLVTLAAELRKDGLMSRIFDTPEVTLTGGQRVRHVVNRNTLVRTVPYVNGVKTGYTLGAGNVLVASATRDGVTLISAVLGAPSEAARDAESLELLEYGFSLYRQRRAIAAGEPLASAELAGQDASLVLAARDPVKVTVRRGQEVETAIEAPAEVEGPVERGERLGSATVSVDGEVRGRTAIVAASSAPAASLGDRVDSALPGSRLLAWILIAAGGAALTAAFLRIRGRGE